MDGLEMTGQLPLFASPLTSFRVPDAETLNALLIAEVAARRAAEPSMARSNRGGWRSADDLFRRTEPGHRRLAAHMLDAVRALTRQQAPEAALEGLKLEAEGWINVNPPGALNAPHDHPAWLWSGCYYVTMPVPADPNATEGCIEFLDNRTNLRVVTAVDLPFMRSKAMFRPPAGTMILFPSHLLHWVYPHEGEGERISVAFNARFARG